jgi:hypothetical protein
MDAHDWVVVVIGVVEVQGLGWREEESPSCRRSREEGGGASAAGRREPGARGRKSGRVGCGLATLVVGKWGFRF